MNKYLLAILVLIGVALISPFILFTGVALFETISLDYEYYKKQKFGTTNEQCAHFVSLKACESNKGCNWIPRCYVEKSCSATTSFDEFVCIVDPNFEKPKR